MRWTLKLQEFDFRVEYKRGKENVVADGLSRLPIQELSEEGEKCLESQVSNEEERTVNLVTVFKNKVEELKIMQENDKKIQRILRSKLYDNRKFQKEGVWYFRWRKNLDRPVFEQLLVPEDLKQEVLTRCHDDSLTGGHLGEKKTFEKIQKRFWWPKWKKDVGMWIKSYVSCNLKKDPR